jgi:hypothetical protein
MKSKLLYLLALLACAAITFQCSDDDDPELVNEEEVITTMIVTLVEQGTSGSPIILRSQDLDGDGPGAPVITVSGPFSSNTTYDGDITVLNETESPVEDVTVEIEGERDEHQFFFLLSGTIDVDIDYTDGGGAGGPVGLTFSLTTGEASTGTLTIVLRHEPDKDAPGVSDGDITNAGGETDIEQTFSIEVQ